MDGDIVRQDFHAQLPSLARHGRHQGRRLGNAYGAKLKSLDDLPPGVLSGLQRKTPAFFSSDLWKTPHFELKDYMATHKPA